jgi:hypothetical protein
VLKKLMTVVIAVAGPAAAMAQERTPAAAQQAAAAVPQAKAVAQQAAAAPQAAPGEPKALAGMSILGNQEAPKSLVIVPWKSSEIGNGIGVSRALDTRIRAVDKDVFMRELKYYAIRSGAQQ